MIVSMRVVSYDFRVQSYYKIKTKTSKKTKNDKIGLRNIRKNPFCAKKSCNEGIFLSKNQIISIVF